ncbi:MAG TPA: DUF4870 domain-containing protein [Ktedonobacteraceae bacterium]|nr:DUF4870 domain-containing protein [Ktedonobacteraceae bacterium]
MKNYPNEAYTPYGGYRGAATAQPLEAPNDLPESSPESYHTPSEGEYQQQEQLYSSQQHYGYQQPYLAPPVGYIGRDSMVMRVPAAGWLSYLGGWVTGLIFLLLKRENRFVRFHAMQSLIFFGAMGIVTTVLSHISFLGFIGAGLGFVSFICWIVLIIKAARGRYYKLPIIGDYAEKWANSLRD